MSKCDPQDQARSDEIIRGGNTTTPEVLALVSTFKRAQCFGDARKLLGYYRNRPKMQNDPNWPKLTHEYSLCTYKDVDLPPTRRFELALQILSELDLATTTDQETLGQAGAICKNRWEIFNQKADLDRSISYYLRGYQAGYDPQNANGYGYNGVNAAFLLDLLARQERTHAQETGSDSENAHARIQQAAGIRQQIVNHYDTLDRAYEEKKKTDKNFQSPIRNDWWEMATWAEACFGIALYKDNGPSAAEATELFDNAQSLLKDAQQRLKVDPWQVHSSVKQFVALAEIHTSFSSDSASTLAHAQEAVAVLLHDFPGARDSAKVGKVGLGLSGGGFRASLFHIGVLARLAESDVLRHIEVISCVSGGSILGAHYYLELRQLLRWAEDGKITQQDYIDLVKRVEKDFVDGVQTNLRTKGLTSLVHNLMAAGSSHYTITDYVGKLYETQLYSRVQDNENKKPRYLSGLFIQPLEEKEGFNPRHDNWKRLNKVPMLVLNATALNTGHTWQFTASWMGEPPVGADDEVDRNFRLRRVYYDAPDLPDKYRSFPLGRAVAASACVPGLFEPVELDGLYPEIAVRLVDGGVHDNQGTSSLLEENCSVVLVSDASGQMVSEKRPASGTLDVPLRSNSILQARVREAEFDELAARKRSSLLRGLMFLHLKKDLDAERVNWIGHREPDDPADQQNGHNDACTSYGIDKKIQHQLAATRTDLDSFSDVEACALMCSGYAMADKELQESEDLKRLFSSPRTSVDWRFLRLMPAMGVNPAEKESHNTIVRNLNVSCKLAGKPWRLAPVWCIVVTIALAAIVGVSGWLLDVEFASLARIFRSIGAWIKAEALWAVVLLIAIIFGALKSARVRRILMALIMIPGSLIGALHRHLYDKRFLSVGSLDRFQSSAGAAPPPAPAPPPKVQSAASQRTP